MKNSDVTSVDKWESRRLNLFIVVDLIIMVLFGMYYRHGSLEMFPTEEQEGKVQIFCMFFISICICVLLILVICRIRLAIRRKKEKINEKSTK